MTEVRLLPEAELDLAEAALFLEQRASGLGSSLTDEVDDAIHRWRRTLYSRLITVMVFTDFWFIASRTVSSIEYYPSTC